MKLIITVKPSVVQGRSKDEIKSKLNLYGWCSSNHGSYFSQLRHTDDYIYVINFQKFRRKTKQTKKVVDGKSVTKSKVIRPTHWVGFPWLS